jgi:hypothetical protein
VEHDIAWSRAEQNLRQEILPLEHAPRIVEAVSGVLRGTNLTLYGDDAGLVRQVGPLVDAAARIVERSLAGAARDAGRADAGE